MPGGEGGSVDIRERARVVEGVGGACDHPFPRRRDLFLVRPVGEKRRERRVERRLDGRDRLAGKGRRVEREPGLVARGGVVGRRPGGDGLVHDQGPVQATHRSPAEQLGEDLEGQRVLRIARRVTRGEVAADELGLCGPAVHEFDPPRADLGRLPRARAHCRPRSGRDGSVVLLGQRAQRLGGDVAGHDQDGVIGDVMAVVERQRVGPRQGFDLVAPADDGRAVRVVQELRRRDLLGQQGGRRGVRPAAALFQDHRPFRLHERLGQDQVAHPVGLEFHREFEMFAGDALEIGGVVGGREGAVAAAARRDFAREFARPDARRALEHEVFEEVREARLAGRVVGRADAIPDHVDHHRRPAVLQHHHLHPVVEGEGVGGEKTPGLAVRLRRGGARADERGERGRDDEPANVQPRDEKSWAPAASLPFLGSRHSMQAASGRSIRSKGLSHPTVDFPMAGATRVHSLALYPAKQCLCPRLPHVGI